MRTFVAILVFYGNAIAPWHCCCAAAKAVETAPPFNNSTAPYLRSAPKRSHCCEKLPSQGDSQKSKSPKKECPCPAQGRLLAERPVASLEKVGLDSVKFMTLSFGSYVETAIDFSAARSLALPAIGVVPTLLTADRMLKYHHRYLC